MSDERAVVGESTAAVSPFTHQCCEYSACDWISAVNDALGVELRGRRAFVDDAVALVVAERNRLLEHARSLHRLNGYSKQKGWWCSCLAWKADMPYVKGETPPWQKLTEASALHAEHVQDVLR